MAAGPGSLSEPTIINVLHINVCGQPIWTTLYIDLVSDSERKKTITIVHHADSIISVPTVTTAFNIGMLLR